MDIKSKQVKQPNQPTVSGTGKTKLPKLPKGWSRRVVKRLQGRSEGKLDIYVYNPEGKKFRSKNEITAYLKKNNINNIDVEVFDFSTRNTTVVIPKGANIVKPPTQVKAPVKRKVESPSAVLAKKRKVESPSNLTLAKKGKVQPSASMATTKSAADMRSSLSKFVATVKLENTKSDEEKSVSEQEDSVPDLDSVSSITEMSGKETTTDDVVGSTAVKVSMPDIISNLEVSDDILLTVEEEVITEGIMSDVQRLEPDDDLTMESTISLVTDEDSTCESLSDDTTKAPPSTTQLAKDGQLPQCSIMTNTEDDTLESDTSEHFDETPLRLAMLQQMTAIRRESDISSEDESTVDSITYASVLMDSTDASESVNISAQTISKEVVSEGTDADQSIDSVVLEQAPVSETVAVENVDSSKPATPTTIINGDSTIAPEHNAPTSSATLTCEEQDISMENDVKLDDTQDLDEQDETNLEVQNKTPELQDMPTVVSEPPSLGDNQALTPDIKQEDDEIKDVEKADSSYDVSEDKPEVPRETESDFVNEMLVPDNIILTASSKECINKDTILEIQETAEEKETKVADTVMESQGTSEEKDIKVAETGTDTDHEPFESEHAMVKKLLENSTVHLYKPALSEKIEEMLIDIDKEPGEINQEAFVLKLGLEKMKEASNGFHLETDIEEAVKIEKTEDQVKENVNREELKIETLQTDPVSCKVSPEVTNIAEPGDSTSIGESCATVLCTDKKEVPDLINIEKIDKSLDEVEPALSEPSFEMPDIINIEKNAEEDSMIDDEIKMPELEPMVLTEAKKGDEIQQTTLQKKILIDWPAICKAVEESSDSDSTTIESYDSDSEYKTEDDQSNSSNGGTTSPVSKKLKLSPYFKNSSDSKKNIMKCKYFKTSESTEIPGANEIIKSLNWVPPKSPYNLIQESLYQDPWRLLIATIFLNRTSGKVAIPLVWKFFDRWATPEAAYTANKEELAQFLQPMGLNNRRANQIMRFSYEFEHKSWLYPKELFGISKYGNDSFRIFCRKEWRKVKPLDHKLNLYHNWLCQNWKALGI